MDCRTGRVFLQSDVEEAVTDMHHMFRQHGRGEFEVDLSGRPVREDTLLSNLDRSTSASAPSADISVIRSAALSETGSEAPAAGTSSRADAESEAGTPESWHMHSAPAQHAPEDSSEAASSLTSAATIECEPDEDAGSAPAAMQEPIDWLDANPLVWPWLPLLMIVYTRHGQLELLH